MRRLKVLMLLSILFTCVQPTHAISLALDSIAQWGKFARFCVNTYYWGDRTFNTFDTTYVQGTGMKFKVMLTQQNWLDTYHLDFKPEGEMTMVSDIASNIGVHISYLAVSVGYDMNLNKFFNGYERSRKRVNFSFNCALFSADFYIQNNDLTTHITKFKTADLDLKPRIRFDGMKTDRWGFDIYYFFNNKRYSQAAAFSYTRRQLKSQGSWYLGLSYCNQKYNFDFNTLPLEITDPLENTIEDLIYRTDTKTYAIKGGYAYNWVPHKNWLVSISESPIIGYRTGKVNYTNKHCLAFSNILRAGVVYNLNKFFVGIQCSVYTNFARDQESTLTANVFTTDLSIGYRFNLW